MKIVKRLFTCVLLLIVACVSGGLWILYGSKTSNQEENIEALGAIEYTALLTAGIGNMCGHHRQIGTLGLNH